MIIILVGNIFTENSKRLRESLSEYAQFTVIKTFRVTYCSLRLKTKKYNIIIYYFPKDI